MMNRKTFKRLFDLCRRYDPFTRYIDSYKQELQAEKANAAIEKEFNEIMAEYTDEKNHGIPYGCENCYGEELEKNLTEWLNAKDIEVEPRKIWTEEEISTYIETNDTVVMNAFRKISALGANKSFLSDDDKKSLRSIYDQYLRKHGITEKQFFTVRKILMKYIPNITVLSNQI